MLGYSLQAVRSVTRTADLDRPIGPRDPIIALRSQLEKTHAAQPDLGSLSSAMERTPEFELVRRWQDAARLAVQGEREIIALQHSLPTREQERVVLKDAADLVRGVALLDLRYKNVPGWTHLQKRGRLQSAADAVSQQLAEAHRDTSVDQLGWRPTPGIIDGPALPGLAGVLQAQHNAVVDLVHFPSALNLRHLLTAQADLSAQAAGLARAVGSPQTPVLEQRASLYRELVAASRSLGGQLGQGRNAALESAYAARREVFLT